MTPETNRNGKRPIQLEPFKNFNPSNSHIQLQHQHQLVGNYQDRNPLDPVINNSSKRHRVGYITDSPLQVAFENLAPSNGSINCLQQSVKKPLLGLIFSRPNQSNHYQKDQNLQPPLDLLNPNGTNPSPTQRRTTRTPSIRNAFPVPSNNHQAITTPLPNPHVHGKESRLVKDKQRNKEDLKKEILQWQEKYRVAIKSFVFYLDRLESDTEVELCRRIQTWGARVDQFFSKDVTHVITDQPLPTNSSLCSPSTNLRRRSSQSLTNQHIPLCKNLSPSPNKENGNSQAFKRPLRRLNGINQEDDCQANLEINGPVDSLIRKALELKMKIWKSEKLINVLCRLEDYRVFVKHSPAKPSLPSLLLKEAQQGHTHEQDPVATRPDFYYFPPKAAFIMVEDVIQEFKPIIVKEYARPKTREATAWPVMWGGTEGKSAFSNYTSKQSLLHVRNRIRTMFEHYVKEFNIQNLNQPNPEQFNKTLESEKKVQLPNEKLITRKRQEIAKKTDDISVHPDPTAPKAETPAQNVRRTVSMNILQRRQSARLNRIPATPKPSPIEIEDTDDITPQEIDHINQTAPDYLRGPGKVFLAASGNSVAVTSNLPSAPSTRSSALRTATLSGALVDKRLAALGKRPTFQMSPKTPLTCSSALKLEFGARDRRGQQSSNVRQLLELPRSEDPKQKIKRSQSLDGAMMLKKKEEEALGQQRSGRRGLGVRAKLGTGYDLLDLKRMVKIDEPKAGYCENCRIKYPDFKRHILTRKHRKFALDESNWVDLDELMSKATRKLKPDIRIPPSLKEMLGRCYYINNEEEDDEEDEEGENNYDDEEEVEEYMDYTGIMGGNKKYVSGRSYENEGCSDEDEDEDEDEDDDDEEEEEEEEEEEQMTYESHITK